MTYSTLLKIIILICYAMNYLNPCWGETAKAYADCHGFRGFGHYFWTQLNAILARLEVHDQLLSA